MRESGYYPPGAEFDPSAPYNEVEPPEIDLGVTVYETLTKETSVITNNAYYVTDEEGWSGLETGNFKPIEEYQEQNELLSIVIAKAKEEITKLREEAESNQRKLEEHYGVRHGCIPGGSANDEELMKMRKFLWKSSERVRQLKALEEGLDGWEHEDIDVQY